MNTGNPERMESTISETHKVIDALAGSLNDHLDTQIARADQKAQLILAACTFMAATIVPLASRINFDLLDPALPPMHRFALIAVALVVVFLLLCVYFSLLVTRPSLSARAEKHSLLYFGNIIHMTEKEFIASFLKQHPEEIRDAILSQVYQKARIADKKFGGIRRSLNFLFLTFLFWALAGVLLTIAR